MTSRQSWLFSLAFWPHALLAFDLTPTHGFRDLEGFRIPVVHFADGARRITYQPPHGWRVSGSGATLQIFPPGLDGAAMGLRTMKRAVTNSAAVRDDFESWTRAQLPPVATDVKRTGESAGQFTIGAQPSRAVSFSYTQAGHRFFASVAAVDLHDDLRLAVVVTARQSDFKSVQDEAIASLFSWQWDEP